MIMANSDWEKPMGKDPIISTIASTPAIGRTTKSSESRRRTSNLRICGMAGSEALDERGEEAWAGEEGAVALCSAQSS
eukprot:CAMPEP_0172194772 /NCGR_PEP_ID=MMETSP1050-20130122/25794_1 /TAXON_ID=233186 /ORGANISM="Cryptomonas curvata, Strain CCAP979/52" /LENGTH=77 /DNA_ID=CAMNT_0012870673 /DNA_START=67 /DNA_END=297 /DNA_ORIENTATION=-